MAAGFLYRFNAYHARYVAGTLGLPRPRRPRPTAATPGTDAAASDAVVSATKPARARLRLPGEFGWVAKCGTAESNASV